MIGNLIRPFGDQCVCILLSEVDEKRMATVLWQDGSVGSAYIESFTNYGNIFERLDDFIDLTKKCLGRLVK